MKRAFTVGKTTVIVLFLLLKNTQTDIKMKIFLFPLLIVVECRMLYNVNIDRKRVLMEEWKYEKRNSTGSMYATEKTVVADVANTSEDSYNAYVEKCKNAGYDNNVVIRGWNVCSR